MDYFTWTPLETFAIAFTTACIFLAGKNSIHTWWVGIIACVLFGTLFYSVQLYAEVLLQVFFVGTSLIGWYIWRKCGVNVTPIVRTSRQVLLIYFVAALLAAGAYGLILHEFTNAWAPFIDSGVLTFSILAQYLLMTRRLETWYFWIFVNILSVPLYFSRELYMTAGLYSVFLVHAIWAAGHWKKQMETRSKGVGSPRHIEK
jgi:nicotinamide mononucleotide transporter